MKQIKAGKKELHIVDDKLGTPTYTHDFVSNVKLLIEKGHYGLFNMVCGGLTSRFEVATELVQLLGLKDDIKIIPVAYADEAIRLGLTKELKLIEWTEVEGLSKSGKEDKTQASIQ